jgi:hypothetical protein
LFASELAQRTCHAFEGERWRLPIVAVHGDAHLLQFVVTGKSYGLEDFDRSGFGPSVVDLVRYGVSLHLACREVGFACDATQLITGFLAAYRAALDEPPKEPRSPEVVSRLRSQVPEASAWLPWAESLMRPLTPVDKGRVGEATAAFVQQQRNVRPDRPESFYQVVSAGRLSMGIGSGLERKLLFRIQGPSGVAYDDLIVEARTTTRRTQCDCVWWPDQGGALQPLWFMSLLGRRMPVLFGFGDYGTEGERREYWVQAWDPGYRELTLSDLQSQRDLEELANDAAAQLGGHFWTVYPKPLRAHQRFAQLKAFDLVVPRVPTLARELADELVIGWQRFRQTSGTP